LTTAYLNRVATAVPEHDVHDSFVVFAEQMLTNLMAEGDDIDSSQVHPCGRSILDAIERGLELLVDALAASREVLSRFGNISSATAVTFVLQKMMRHGQRGPAMSFGRGLTAEKMRFHGI
jgi:alpha-pyrone synthase